MNQTTITINQKQIGMGCPIYIIAEMSANHGHSLDAAIAILQSAKEAGADAIKLQTYTPDTLTIKSDRECFRISGGTAWDGKTLHDLYGEAYTPWHWHPKLKEVADELGLDFFSSAFDSTAVEFLESLDVVAHKVASFEIVDIPLIENMAGTGKPLIISTGMAIGEEIDDAISAARKAGATQIAILKCTSAYPAPPEEMNLRTIPNMAEKFGLPVGLSDHTMGFTAPVAAVALGACIIEKHLTLSRRVPGPDSTFSLEPDEFKEMVQAIRFAEKALGQVHYGVSEHEAKSRVFRRSLFVVEDIEEGDVFTEKNIRSIRPGHGLPPKDWNLILGKRAAQRLTKGTPLSLDLISEG